MPFASPGRVARYGMASIGRARAFFQSKNGHAGVYSGHPVRGGAIGAAGGSTPAKNLPYSGMPRPSTAIKKTGDHRMQAAAGYTTANLRVFLLQSIAGICKD